MLSVLYSSATVLILATPTSAWVGFDMYSNGRYWTGWPWSHKPRHGETGNCVCMKGYEETSGRLEGHCTKGMWFNDLHEDQTIGVHFDMSKPIDITIYGDDALWVDRFIIRSKNGSRDRHYGGNNTHGYCLSTDPTEYFDKWATHDGCSQTHTLLPNGKTVPSRSRAGYWKQKSLLDQTQRNCNFLFGRGRRRVEPNSAEGTEVLNIEDLDDDPEIHAGSHMDGQHAQIVSGLQNAIKQLVRDNSDVTNEQINSVLNSLMSRAEEELDDTASEDASEEEEGSLVRRLLGA